MFPLIHDLIFDKPTFVVTSLLSIFAYCVIKAVRAVNRIGK